MSDKTKFTVLLVILLISIGLLIFAQHNLQLQSIRGLR